jgi:hypothetical protein
MPRTAHRPLYLLLAGAFAALSAMPALAAGQQTVCTITVNSSDEKEAFRRYLPADKFRFVELVERGRPDWLESARRKGVRCDILVISGHYDGGDYAGGNEFFSEHVDSREYLPVDEMERVACSEPDDGLFAHLKAVYLFGCNTLNPVALRSAPEEIARTLVRAGHAPADAERVARAMSPRFADSSRDRMRHIFRNVPALYGFSSVAPLGPVAATYLGRYLQSGGAQEIASGKPTSRILGYFPGRSFTLTRGSVDGDPDAAFRDDTCQFLDDRVPPVAKATFVHRLLGRDMAEVRLFLDRLERYSESLAATAQAPELARALQEIADDDAARARFLAFTRQSEDPQLRIRMIDVAANLGWLSRDDRRAEFGRLIAERFARSTLTAADVDLVCKLDNDHTLDDVRPSVRAASPMDDVGHLAVLACLGAAGDRERLLQALTSPSEADVQIAQVYLMHRPIANVDELRDVAAGIARMAQAGCQVLALDTLADHRVSDPEALRELARLFPLAKSIDVQRAIAGVLIRADYQAMAMPELVRTLREHRFKSPSGRDLIDVLINRLEAAS